MYNNDNRWRFHTHSSGFSLISMPFYWFDQTALSASISLITSTNSLQQLLLRLIVMITFFAFASRPLCIVSSPVLRRFHSLCEFVFEHPQNQTQRHGGMNPRIPRSLHHAFPFFLFLDFFMNKSSKHRQTCLWLRRRLIIVVSCSLGKFPASSLSEPISYTASHPDDDEASSEQLQAKLDRDLIFDLERSIGMVKNKRISWML